jgi:hypothetical protein
MKCPCALVSATKWMARGMALCAPFKEHLSKESPGLKSSEIPRRLKMKSHLVRTLLIAGLTVAGSLTLSAQNNKSVDAKIPFAFTVNHQAMPAGDYQISEIGVPGTFQLNEYTQGKSVLTGTSGRPDSPANEKGHLTFACYQGGCVLAAIWLPDHSAGYARSARAVDDELQRKLGMATMVNVRLGR